MKRRKALPLLVLVLAVAGVLYYLFLFQAGRDEGAIRTSGQIETTEIDMSFRLAGHVSRLHVDEGYQVTRGMPIAELDRQVIQARRDQTAAQVAELEARVASLALTIDIREGVLDAEVKRARAGVSAAGARYQSLKTGSREEEIAEASAVRDRARTEWENRRRDFQRMKDLYERKIISFSQFDAARTSEEAARAAYEAAEERFKLVKIGPRSELIQEGAANLAGSDAALAAAQIGRREVEKLKVDLRVIQAQVEQARALLRIAEDDLTKSILHAPIDGFVTVKDIEEGEFVQPGTPVLTVARLDEVWVKTYVPETQLGKVYLGQKGEVVSDTFPDKVYAGTVTFISPEAEFTPKNVQTREERVKLVYRIKVTIKNPRQELKPGMPVDVVLRRQHG
ncbi:MAG: HlyD family efflux transporter periplasmic adaptor subunit [Desulfobacteraceae bacterium]|nr:MAG: HlyD family efflux transporter periplasmic adaptor subunit [Desulfobacteraceae bacterium]